MIRFFLWLQKIFFFQIQGNFKVNDRVTWDISSEEGRILFREFGKGPFRVAGFKARTGKLLLSDSSGIILVARHYHPKEVDVNLLKLI